MQDHSNDWRWLQLNALGVVDSRESEQSIKIRFYFPKGRDLRATEKKRYVSPLNNSRYSSNPY